MDLTPEDPLDGVDLLAVIPFTVWPVDGSEADARSYTAASAQQAAELRAKDDYDDQNEWSIAYHVRDGMTGHRWQIHVGMVAQPSFITLEARRLPMPAATHVMWGGSVLCGDLRLRAVPRDWPVGQRWISLSDVANGLPASPDGCAACWAKAPGIVDGIRQMGKRL